MKQTLFDYGSLNLTPHPLFLIARVVKSADINILVACEESQAVTIELRNLGLTAFSCDLKPCSGGHPEWHIQGDAVKEAHSGKYHAMFCFPPCTHLAVSGARWFKDKIADGRQQEGIDLFMSFAKAPIPSISIENPIGIMCSKWRKPDQIIQPYQFGDTERKTTCLWLTNLPQLKHTKVVEPVFSRSGLTKTHIGFGRNNNSNMRSKTFPGIASAMANQWSKFLLETYC